MSQSYPEIDKAIKDMLKGDKDKVMTFEERKQAIELAIKFELLKIKAKGGKWGSGFKEGAEDDELE